MLKAVKIWQKSKWNQSINKSRLEYKANFNGVIWCIEHKKINIANFSLRDQEKKKKSYIENFLKREINSRGKKDYTRKEHMIGYNLTLQKTMLI